MNLNIANAEKLLIKAAMVACHSNRHEAAKELGIGERTLYRKLREYKITVPKIERPKRQVTVDLDSGKVVKTKK